MMSFKTSLFDMEYIEASDKGHKATKVMIVMHGLGDQRESFVPLVKEINVTGLNYLLLNAPFDYPIGYTWYDIPPEDPRPKLESSLSRLVDLVEELNQHGFSNSDIFVMGFSQGGGMSLELGNALKRSLAGMAALSPKWTLEGKELSSAFFETPLFCAHGKYDEMIPYQETSGALESRSQKFKDFTFKSYPMGHEICLEEIRDLRDWVNNHL